MKKTILLSFIVCIAISISCTKHKSDTKPVESTTEWKTDKMVYEGRELTLHYKTEEDKVRLINKIKGINQPDTQMRNIGVSCFIFESDRTTFINQQTATSNCPAYYTYSTFGCPPMGYGACFCVDFMA